MVGIEQLRDGERATIVGFQAMTKTYQHKLMAMGLTRGTTLQIVRRAPMGDPIAISVRGCCVCLRQAEAQGLKLERLI